MATKSLSSHGTVAYWGITPALDLLSHNCSTLGTRENSEQTFSALICAAADCRHVLKSITQLESKDLRNVNFYLLNPLAENMARDMLLLSLAEENPAVLSPRAKTEMFLELYGNLKIREQTQTYLTKKCKELIGLAANEGTMHGGDRFDLTHLKYRERDELELIFRRWSEPVPAKVNLSKCWENRLRRDLERRYDHRIGAFDWDFSMNLCELGANVITATKYFRWRETGMAFELRDESAYIHQNPTLVSKFSVFTKDTSYSVQGFWGDMLTSPYIAFGTGSDAAKYRKLCNNVDTIASAEISESILLDCFEKIDHPAQITECSGDGEPKATNYKFIFLSPGSYGKLCEKAKYHGLFDLIYVGGRATVESTGGLGQTLAPSGVILFESPRFLIGLAKERCKKYYEHIHPKMLQAGFKVMEDYDEKVDDVFKYVRPHEPSKEQETS